MANAATATTGLSKAASKTSLRSTGVISHPWRSRGRLALERSTQLLLLVLDKPADHLPPKRLAQIGRYALGGRAHAHLVDHLLVAPGHACFLLCHQLQLPGPLHVAKALGNQIDQGIVDAVDLDADRRHVTALGMG